MPRKSKTPHIQERMHGWLGTHPKLACLLVATSTFCALVGLAAFVTFSGFGASADFIYNQF